MWPFSKKLEPKKRNAVIVEYRRVDTHSEPQPSVSMECADYDMEYFLVLKCRETLWHLGQRGSATRDEQ